MVNSASGVITILTMILSCVKMVISIKWISLREIQKNRDGNELRIRRSHFQPEKSSSVLPRTIFQMMWLGRKDLNPRNGGVRVHCLTTWRRPNFYDLIILSHFREFVNTFYKKNQIYSFIIYYKKISVKIGCKSLSIPTAKRRP